MQETPPAAANRRPDAAALDRLGVALRAFDLRSGRIVWANRAACALWDARDADALAARDVTAGLSPGAARRLALHRADPHNHPRPERALGCQPHRRVVPNGVVWERRASEGLGLGSGGHGGQPAGVSVAMRASDSSPM